MSTISVPDQLKTELDAFAQERGIAPNDLARDAIEDYIYFWRIRELRARMTEEAKAQDLLTDEDIFERIS
jgi:predicted transcriptional regulator